MCICMYVIYWCLCICERCGFSVMIICVFLFAPCVKLRRGSVTNQFLCNYSSTLAVPSFTSTSTVRLYMRALNAKQRKLLPLRVIAVCLCLFGGTHTHTVGSRVLWMMCLQSVSTIDASTMIEYTAMCICVCVIYWYLNV